MVIAIETTKKVQKIQVLMRKYRGKLTKLSKIIVQLTVGYCKKRGLQDLLIQKTVITFFRARKCKSWEIYDISFFTYIK